MTLYIWLAVFLLLCGLLLVRPIWGVALYMLTFFAFPGMWWWGESLSAYRWNLYGGIGLLIATVVSGGLFNLLGRCQEVSKRMLLISTAIVANATFVNFLLTTDLELQAEPYQFVLKFVLLQIMIASTIRTRKDIQLAFIILAVCSGYIGFEVSVNDRGEIHDGRLEGVGAPGATSANELASLIITVLPLAGVLALAGSTPLRLLAMGISAMLLNVVVSCNSRGAFLGGIFAGIVTMILVPAKIRTSLVVLIVLGAVGFFALAGQQILDRFSTTFASAENRDASAANRLIFWQAGLAVISDHPLGTGGGGFKKIYGRSYLERIQERDVGERAIHNGYINEACEWGVQGLLLHVLLIACAFTAIWRRMHLFTEDQEDEMALLGCGIIAGLVAFLGTCMFGDRLDNEWGYWMCGLAMAYTNLPERETDDSATGIDEPQEHVKQLPVGNEVP